MVRVVIGQTVMTNLNVECECFLPLLVNVCVSPHAGMGGHYVLDEYGDRDVNFSIIYTSTVTGKVVYCSFVK